jgi:hypothetical protein
MFSELRIQNHIAHGVMTRKDDGFKRSRQKKLFISFTSQLTDDFKTTES